MTDAEIALMKKQIEIQLDEYAEAMRLAEKWYREWKARQRTQGFRCMKEDQA